MPDSSDLDYNPNNKTDIDDRRKKLTKRKKRNAGGRNTAPKLTIYQCSLCSYRTGLRTILKRHFAVCFSKPKALRQQSNAVNIANVRATFRCEFCCFATTTSFMLMKHKSSHFSRIQNGLVECSHCDLTFFTMAECKKHMSEQSDLYETKPIEDNISSSSRIHSKSSNSTELNGSLYSCWCGVFQSASRSQYLHHLKRTHSINFDSFEEINENDEVQEGNETENCEATEEFGCPMPGCSFQAHNEDYLEIHLTQHQELDDDHIEIGIVRDETKQYKTRKINETIETTGQQQNSSVSDMELLEDLQKQVKFIEVCAANDEDDSDLSDGEEVLEKNKIFACEFCAYETTDYLHLEFHNRLMHNLNSVYKCPQVDCLFKSKNQSSFKVHVFVTHQISDIVENPINGPLMASQLNGINPEQSKQINFDPNVNECLESVDEDTDENETIRIEIVEDQTDNTTEEDSLKNNFKGDVKLDTIKITCDRRESSNEPTNRKTEKALNIAPPSLGYDPNLPVFSCTECNFKTNESERLDKHKSLHWNAEKDTAYKEKQWFTCEICFYYCFDAVRFKQHQELHLKHPVSITTKLE